MMNESLLKTLFINFLEQEKEYPFRSIAPELAIGDQIQNRRIVDLALIDPESKDILAIVEFEKSGNSSVIKKALWQINVYRNSLYFSGRNILAFVVIPSDNGFTIYKQVSNIKDTPFVKVQKEDFPSYSDLSFNVQVQENIKLKEQELSYIKNTKNKTRLLENYTIAAIIGIITVILGFYISYNRAASNRETEELLFKADKVLASIEESRKKQVQQSKINFRDKPDSLIFYNRGIPIDRQDIENKLYNNVEKKLHDSIEGRLANIESMLSKEPEKTLTILELKSQVSELKTLIENKNNLYDEKISTIKERADLLSNLTWALALTVLATLVAGLIAAFQALKKG